LYDALGVYLNGAYALSGDKILVLYTDGGDTRSAMNQGELLDLLKASDVTVYPIGYLQHQGSGRHEQQQILTRFAATTGGQAYFPASLKDLDRMYDRILREISGRYSIGYVSTNEKLDGAWREVKVRLAEKPEFKNAKIRTRSGYYAPYKPTSQK
jgi:VWFA-related protein